MNPLLLGLPAVIAGILFEALSQICFKHGADEAHHKGVAKHRVLWIAGGMLCFGINATFWTIALSKLPASVVHPLGSLELILLAIAGRVILKEQITGRRWAGVVCILIGAALVAGSSH